MKKCPYEQTDAGKKRIKALFAAMPKVDGEIRTVERCSDCGHLFGRRFIPFGLGRGLSVDLCMCQLTAHRPSETVAKRKL